MKTAAEMIAAGASDQAIADKIGCVSRMAVQRHRVNHVIKPALALADAAGKGTSVRQEREKLVEAAQTDAVAAYIGLAGIVDTLKGVGTRLDRVADTAEQGGALGAVAALSAQQTKVVETRAKLGQVGSYAPAKAATINLPSFQVNFNFSRGAQTIDMLPAPVDEDGPELDDGRGEDDGADYPDDLIEDA